VHAGLVMGVGKLVLGRSEGRDQLGASLRSAGTPSRT
jgi:hypothetical protein